jgi:hypothetical protein
VSKGTRGEWEVDFPKLRLFLADPCKGLEFSSRGLLLPLLLLGFEKEEDVDGVFFGGERDREEVDSSSLVGVFLEGFLGDLEKKFI